MKEHPLTKFIATKKDPLISFVTMKSLLFTYWVRFLDRDDQILIWNWMDGKPGVR